MTNDETVHQATIAYQIKDVQIINGSIYAKNFRHLVYHRKLIEPSTSDIVFLKSAALASSFIGTKYFGHWICDDCVQYLLAEQLGEAPLCLPRDKNPHQKNYEEYFQQDWKSIGRARISNLIVFEDFAQNSSKRQRYQVLRQRVSARFPSTGRRSYVYLRRGRTGRARMIANEEEILTTLVSHGFVILDIEADSIDWIISNLVNAKIVISIEGSHISHCTFSLPSDSGIVVLQPSDRFTAIQRDWSDCLGVRFAFVVGTIESDKYRFHPLRLLRTVDLMLASLT